MQRTTGFTLLAVGLLCYQYLMFVAPPPTRRKRLKWMHDEGILNLHPFRCAFDGRGLRSLVLRARRPSTERFTVQILANRHCGCSREFVSFYENINDRESERIKKRG